MDSLRSMRLFVRTVELGNFSAVAREEGTGQPTISKVIAAFEKTLGVRLLERSTTNVAPTDEGRRFYERCKRVLDEYANAVADVRGQTLRPVGKLVVNAPTGLGELRLNALVLEFLAACPEIEVELHLTDRVIDLIEEGVDVAIRLGHALPPDAIARCVASSPRLLVAAPRYVAQSPAIRRPADLAKHEYVGYARADIGTDLEFTRGAEKISIAMRGRYRVNSSLALRECFLAGNAMGSAPAWLVQDLIDGGQLVRLLPKWQMSMPHALHLVYASRRYLPLRTRTFLQFMEQRLPELPGFHVPQASSQRVR
ncbi:LysR family transcriptional regulator [Burkholderia sp. Bp9017]|uniref:LysR family transcriptional regulator n=1 Tax=Burkholderia anthina TaxID=179879 RepID=A0A7T6VMI5_9BURK|nr:MULTISPECIES: LysR family transcriptional regulator [Burkholderia]MBY4865173.1 LysR family transcriptional regulator [Burkholderia anthina]QQK06643.1 LysR family transcriptional regulator [Burkholderia anthina]RQZ23570.1 LysR family transcriptional regulator [Burkholderia sp. Bp9017]RQZ36164.1 LysR family transcriptional regulator [Burkholderia sp. Bp9016]